MAAAVLQRIRDHGAYSNVLLPRATRDLRRQDQAFVYRLVGDALRNQRTIDAVIEAATGRSIEDLDPEVSAVLQIAVGEMHSGDADVYATVNESVEAVKQLGVARASGLVNGALRRLGREGLPTLDGDKARELSVPEWVLGRVTQDHGRQVASELMAGLRTPPRGVGIRVRPGGTVPEGAQPIPGISDTFTVPSVRHESGLVVGDGASSAVAEAVGAQPGDTVLDMAAAPGGKTISLWDQTGGRARLVAMDRHRRRLDSARRRLLGEGVAPIWVLGDARSAPFVSGSFDAVLLDAPCSGLGTLRRRPEIAMRLKVKAMEDLAVQQRSMLAEAWRLVRPGGRIIYSVCTIFAAETVDVVAEYPGQAPPSLPGLAWGNGLLLAPHVTRTDGMFVSVIER